MFANRITRHVQPQATLDSIGLSSTTAQAVVPHGFAPVPVGLLNAIAQSDIYRIAFEAARTAARQKLLAMLRARGEWN